MKYRGILNPRRIFDVNQKFVGEYDTSIYCMIKATLPTRILFQVFYEYAGNYDMCVIKHVVEL